MSQGIEFKEQSLVHIPHKPGVYFFYGRKGEVLYIGKAKSLKNRVKQYFAAGSVWKQDMMAKAIKVDFIVVETESEALYLEDNLIKKHKPPYNSLLKGDNSYTFIKISGSDFPTVSLTKMRFDDGAIYIGPKHRTRELQKLLYIMRQMFRYRSCSQSEFTQGKLCSDYHFGLCAGWCIYAQLKKHFTNEKKNNKKNDKSLIDHGDEESMAGLVTNTKATILELNKSDKAEYVDPREQTLQYENKLLKSAIEKTPGNRAFKQEMIYEESRQYNKKMVHTIRDFFQGKTSSFQNDILQQMHNAVEKQHFEYASVLRDIYKAIEHYTQKQHVVLPVNVYGILVKVKLLGNWYVLVLVHFHAGKMIDVIRTKYKADETDIDEILTNVRADANYLLPQEYETTLYSPQVCSEKSESTQQKNNIGDEKLSDGEYSDEADNSNSTTTNERVFYTKLIKTLPKKIFQEVDKLLLGFIDSYVMSSVFEKDNVMQEMLQELNKRYSFSQFPYTIECLDISHLSGGWTAGGLSALKEGIPHKKGYKRYKIKSIASKSDDYGALKEVLLRRFTKNIDDADLPSVFILDGGQGQLGVIKDIADEHPRFCDVLSKVHFCSLGKGVARKRSSKTAGEKEVIYWFEKGWKIQSKQVEYDDVDRIVLGLRDEAHRFANAYRKKQMSMQRK